MKIDHHMCLWLIHNGIAVHVASRASRRQGRQASLHLVREGLNLFLPSRWKFPGPVVFLRESRRQLTITVVFANRSYMLLAEAGFAVLPMTIVIVISPVFLPMIIMVPSFGTLW